VCVRARVFVCLYEFVCLCVCVCVCVCVSSAKDWEALTMQYAQLLGVCARVCTCVFLCK